MDDFSVASEQNGSVTIVRISGRVDSVTAARLDAELEKVGHANKNMVLDLKKVVYLSSAGVRTFLKAMKNAKKSEGDMKLADIPEQVAESLETAGLLDVFQVYPSIDEAISSF